MGHDLSLYVLHLAGDTVGALAMVLVLGERIGSVVGLLGYMREREGGGGGGGERERGGRDSVFVKTGQN